MGSKGITFKWTGVDDVLRKVKGIPSAVQKGIASALFMEGEELMAASKPLVPVQYGTLRASGFVTLPQKDQNGDPYIQAGFGGPAGSGNQGDTNNEDVGYAVPVHENLEAHHTIGQAKYLEDPFNQRKEGIPARLAERTEIKIQ